MSPSAMQARRWALTPAAPLPPALNHPSRTLSKTCSAASLGLLKVRFVTEKGGGSSDS